MTLLLSEQLEWDCFLSGVATMKWQTLHWKSQWLQITAASNQEASGFEAYEDCSVWSSGGPFTFLLLCGFLCVSFHPEKTSRPTVFYIAGMLAQRKSSTFWQIFLFAFLPRVRCEDWHHSRACVLIIKLSATS